MRETHRSFVRERIDLLWRARAVLALAREKQVGGQGWAAGREAMRFAAGALWASSAVVAESQRLAGIRAVESEVVSDDLERAIQAASREIRELERQLKFAEEASSTRFGRREVARAFLQ